MFMSALAPLPAVGMVRGFWQSRIGQFRFNGNSFMKRHLALASALAVMLAACGTPSKNASETTEPETAAAPDAADTVEAPPPAEAAEDPDVFAAFIPWPADAENVVVRESGLQYVVLESGPEDGPLVKASDCVIVDYEGRISDSGEVFDSSFERGAPETFPAGALIKGWVEGLQLMRPGDEWMMYIPTDLAYGQNPRPGVIQPGDDLTFRVAIRGIETFGRLSNETWSDLLPWDSSDDRVQTTASGLEYIVLAEGDASRAFAEPTNRAVVHYEGRFAATGEPFDSSYSRCDKSMFQANRVIKGWTEMLTLMKPGGRVVVYIPSDLAYGPNGRDGIPPNSDLVFDIQLIDAIPVQ